METITTWLERHKTDYKIIDPEVIEIAGFGKVFISDMESVRSIFRGDENEPQFNLMESPDILMDEGIYYVAYQFGEHWYYYDIRKEFCFNILKETGRLKSPMHGYSHVNLGVHTPYELLNGSGDMIRWVRKAKAMGQNALGICDRNTLAGILAFQNACQSEDVNPVFGYSLTVTDLDEEIQAKLYAQSQRGLQNLFYIQKSVMVDSDNEKIDIDTLCKYAEGIVLVIGKLHARWIECNAYRIKELKDLFDGVYYQIDFNEYKSERIDRAVLEAAKLYFHHLYNQKTGECIIEPVLLNDCYYLDKDESLNKIVLNKIATDAAHNQSQEQYFKDTDTLYEETAAIFDLNKWDIDILFERICHNTKKIALGATARIETGNMYMPRYVMLPEEKIKYIDNREMFYCLLNKALQVKIPEEKQALYRIRLQEEIYIIESTNTVDYFLIQYDMIRYARSKGILTGIGRGSAGGSLVAYLLGITLIDPVEYGLLFSRFLVPERCGLKWCDEVTIIGDDIPQKGGAEYVEIDLPTGKLHLMPDSELAIYRDDLPIVVKASEIKKDDELVMDNRDLLWTLKEIKRWN